ncbi:MAG TPA: hypothetical protein VL359_02475, partial [bacterium]|nr:hypothetical protein [bacterium]
MISRDTVLRAHQWYQVGVSWVEKDAANMGLTYLERAISVFAEAGDRKRLIHAQHQRLVALYKMRQDEEVESHYEEVMQGYLELEDGYGQALLLSLVAQSVARQGRWERALVHLNLAVTLAQAQGDQRLLSFLLARQATLLLEREDVQPALRLLK